MWAQYLFTGQRGTIDEFKPGVTWLNLCFSEGASVAVRMDGSSNSGGCELGWARGAAL